MRSRPKDALLQKEGFAALIAVCDEDENNDDDDDDRGDGGVRGNYGGRGGNGGRVDRDRDIGNGRGRDRGRGSSHHRNLCEAGPAALEVVLAALQQHPYDVLAQVYGCWFLRILIEAAVDPRRGAALRGVFDKVCVLVRGDPFFCSFFFWCV
jgi:hypothetical protein